MSTPRDIRPGGTRGLYELGVLRVGAVEVGGPAGNAVHRLPRILLQDPVQPMVLKEDRHAHGPRVLRLYRQDRFGRGGDGHRIKFHEEFGLDGFLKV